VLTVHPIPDAAEELPGREAVDLGVISVAWHDTEPGQLAWLACVGDQSGDAALFVLDIADRSADPVLVRSFGEGCERSMSVERWADEGTLVVVPGFADTTATLVDTDGTETPIELDPWLLAGSPDGTTLWIERDPEHQMASSFLLSPDGQRRSPVPGLTDDEQLGDASWSPDGAHLALSVGGGYGPPNSLLRVADSTTGAVTMEVAEPGSELITTAWSGDGRFLLYEFWDFEGDSGTLGFYDTATDTTTIVPLSEIVDEIRVRDPAAVPFSGYDDLLFDVDRSTIDGADIGPSSGEAGPYWDGDDSLDTITIRLPLGERTALPDNARLDFLHTACEGTHCFRDAVVVDPDDSSRASGVWIAVSHSTSVMGSSTMQRDRSMRISTSWCPSPGAMVRHWKMARSRSTTRICSPPTTSCEEQQPSAAPATGIRPCCKPANGSFTTSPMGSRRADTTSGRCGSPPAGRGRISD
jgi:hypothetical protein